MSHTDPIADMLTRVRNANKALHAQVEMPSSGQKVELARILRDEGYIAGYSARTKAVSTSWWSTSNTPTAAVGSSPR